MNEKIYLGFAGKYNLRIGESLSIITKFSNVVRQYMSEIKFDELQKYMSNAYLMYNIKDIKTLTNIFNYSTSTMIVGGGVILDDGKRNTDFDREKDSNYLISFETFNFINNTIWPKIANIFIMNVTKNFTHFKIRLNFPLSMINNLYKNELDAPKRFIKDLSIWLDFHLIGKILKIEDENENLTLLIQVWH